MQTNKPFISNNVNIDDQCLIIPPTLTMGPVPGVSLSMISLTIRVTLTWNQSKQNPSIMITSEISAHLAGGSLCPVLITKSTDYAEQWLFDQGDIYRLNPRSDNIQYIISPQTIQHQTRLFNMKNILRKNSFFSKQVRHTQF